MKKKTILATVAAIGLIAACAGGGTDDKDTPSPTTGPTSTVGQAEIGDKEKTSFGDGIWLVNEDIKAGDYTVQVLTSHTCYYERLKATDGELESILANEVIIGPAKVNLTIKKSDKAFKTSGCGTWKIRKES